MGGRARRWILAACSVAISCGGAEKGAAVVGRPPPTSTFALTVSTSGPGSVTSTPAGIDCGTTCKATFPAGATVVLSQAAAAGSIFSGWGGACTGQGACSVTISADTSVTAAFAVAPPPPPPGGRSFTLRVATHGSGTVRSTPAGVDCGKACSATFAAGTRVALQASADSGSSFTGWSGACSGTADCSVVMDTDATVDATFAAAPPPPPPDACAGLTPSPLPDPVVASLPDSDCLGGTSDDGIGNYLLGYLAGGSGPRFPNYLFFTIRDGRAERVGDVVPGSDEGSTQVFSQPSGFSSFHAFGFDNSSRLMSYDHQGTHTGTIPVANATHDFSSTASAGVAIDPAGGTALVRAEDEGGARVTSYRRLDKSGNPETDWIAIDRSSNRVGVGAVGVALSGDVLVIAVDDASHRRARWLKRDGSALTDWFGPIAGDGFPELQFLMDGGLVLRFRARSFPFPKGPWVARFEDGKTEASPAPDWLAQHAGNALFVIRGGRAYATWGSGACGSGLEVVAVSGKSCGCLPVPNLRDPASVGRDGSLIVPRPEPSAKKCQYDLYPQLLK